MSTPAFVTGIIVGSALSMLYAIIHIIKRKDRPRLNAIIQILLNTVGAVAGTNFFYIVVTTITTAPSDLGKLMNDGLTMILGAFSLVYVSLETVYDVYATLWSASRSTVQ